MNEQPKDAYDNHARALQGNRSNGHMSLLAGEVAEYDPPRSSNASLFAVVAFALGALAVLIIGASQ